MLIEARCSRYYMRPIWLMIACILIDLHVHNWSAKLKDRIFVLLESHSNLRTTFPRGKIEKMADISSPTTSGRLPPNGSSFLQRMDKSKGDMGRIFVAWSHVAHRSAAKTVHGRADWKFVQLLLALIPAVAGGTALSDHYWERRHLLGLRESIR